MGDKKKEYRDKRAGIQTVRSAIFAIVLIITGFISIISVADNTYAADEYRVHKSEVVVKTGATYTVKILNHDTKVSPKKFKWTSSNSKCAKVINGRIYGLKPGQATITAQMSGLKVNCEVFVCNKTETVLFKKYKKQVRVTAGKTVILEPQKYGKRLTYTSSDKTVATVSKKGKVTAKKAGNVKITCVSYGTDRYVSEIEVIVLPAASETPEITPTLTPDEPAPSVTPEPTVTVTPTPKITPAPEDEEKFRKPLDGVTHYILHRGEQTEAPENSVPAFEMAGRNGAEFVETDVRETADGVLVVSHDDSLLRMCGEDRLISEMTYEEIKQYPIINGRNASQYPDNLIPTLEQYIACCNKYSVTPVIEIKSIRTEEAMNLFMQLLTESQKEPVIICFRIETLGKLREMGFTGKLQWIRTVRMNASMIQQCKKYDLDISAEYKNISMNDINNAHQSGIRISVWLCRNEDMVDIFRKMGADYITYEKWNTDEVKMRYYSHSTIPRGVLA